MNLIIKGLVIGLGKIIPGVSGALLAITLGEYEKIILNKKYKIDNNTLEELKKQEQDIYYFDIYKSK